MKLTKTSWLILALGITVITFGSLGAANSQRINEKKNLSDDLAVAQVRLSKLDLKEFYSQQERLKQQINETSLQLGVAKAALSQPNDSIDICGAIFRIAADCNVEVDQISSSSLTSGKVGKISCSELPLVTSVSANVCDIIRFILKLNGDLSTGIVKSDAILIGASDNATAANDTPSATDDDPMGDDTPAESDNTTATNNTTANLKLSSADIQLSFYKY